jgi:hypothetical protein
MVPSRFRRLITVGGDPIVELLIRRGIEHIVRRG